MIGRLFGEVLEKQPPQLLIDVNGVGYEVQCPMTTFYRLADMDGKVILHTHLAVSETAQQLYGFFDPRDRRLFRLLIKVNGVGPKLALSILSGMEADDFVRRVMEGNTVALTKLPGVGKKTAERLLIDMRDRLVDFDSSAVPKSATELNAVAEVPSQNAVIAEAESALVALGYKPTDASRMINVASKECDAESAPPKSEALIRRALRSMMPKS